MNITAATYNDLKAFISSLSLTGSVYYWIATESIGNQQVTVNGVLFIGHAVQNSIIFSQPGNQIPSTLLTDFPSAIQLNGIPIVD